MIITKYSIEFGSRDESLRRLLLSVWTSGNDGSSFRFDFLEPLWGSFVENEHSWVTCEMEQKRVSIFHRATDVAAADSPDM